MTIPGPQATVANDVVPPEVMNQDLTKLNTSIVKHGANSSRVLYTVGSRGRLSIPSPWALVNCHFPKYTQRDCRRLPLYSCSIFKRAKLQDGEKWHILILKQQV